MSTSHPPARGGGKLAGALGGRHALLLGGGAAAVVVVLALIRRQSAAAGSSSTTGGALPAYDSTLNDYYSQFEQQLEQIQSQVAGMITPPAGTVPSTAYDPAAIFGRAPSTSAGGPGWTTVPANIPGGAVYIPGSGSLSPFPHPAA